MKEEIIKYGINVRECPHINAYNPNKPICQKGVGVGGNPSECNGNCDYVRNADIERLKKENLHYLACMTEQRNKLKLALEEIRGICSWKLECAERNDNTNGYYEIIDKVNEVLK